MSALLRKGIDQIKLHNFSFSYDNAKKVFDQVNCEIPSNQIFQVSAPSGGGKSTLLKVLAGLNMPSSGHLYFNDEDTSYMSFEEFLPYRLNIGYSFDIGGLLSNKTLFDNLALPLEYHNLFPEDEIKKRVEEGLDRFHLSGVANQRPSAIAGSQRKAAIIARALIMDPQLLLLDNPVFGLSSDNKATLQKWLQERFESGVIKNVFIATEDINFLSPLMTGKIKIENHKLQLDIHIERGVA